MNSPEALYKKLNLLGGIWFDLITFCQDERTYVMYCNGKFSFGVSPILYRLLAELGAS